jgi:hypothetical protein
LKKIIALIDACTTKKEIKNKPVAAMVYFLVNEDLNIPFAIIHLFGTKITPDGIHNTEKQKFPCLFKVYSDKAAEQAVLLHVIPDRKLNTGWLFLACLHRHSHCCAGHINA